MDFRGDPEPVLFSADSEHGWSAYKWEFILRKPIILICNTQIYAILWHKL